MSDSLIDDDVGGAVGEVAVLGNDALMQLLHLGEPGPRISGFDRLNAEPNPLRRSATMA